MLLRLETMILMGYDMPVLAIRQQIASAIDIMVHLGRLRDHSRRVLEISEVLGVEEGMIALHPLYLFREEGERDGRIVGSLKREDGLVRREKAERFRGGADHGHTGVNRRDTYFLWINYYLYGKIFLRIQRVWNGGNRMLKIGIGYEDYKRIIDDRCYYVDKTLLIRDVVQKGGMVTLFTRPRRFGKTLAISMLRTFFELEYDRDGNPVDNRRYFEGKKIMEADPEILSRMGRYPVIKLSLKSAKQPDFKTAFLKLRDEIVGEYKRHLYITRDDLLTDEDKTEFLAFTKPSPEEELRDDNRFREEVGRYSTALKTLSTALENYHGEKVVILLDEYDVPLENAYFKGFYREMTDFIRSLFESALKTNDALEFAVVTGCLRISKESIFTGLNHLQINSIRNDSFSEGFGFTPAETQAMLEAYGIGERMDEVQDWYNGYLFGHNEIYNPWSVVNYVYSIVIDHKEFPEPYWANTSSNEIIKEMVWQADEDMRMDLDALIGGADIEKRIHEDITYDDIRESEDNLWNFLFFTGYLKKVSERQEGKNIYMTMRIPNMEVGSIYEDHISKWFDQIVKGTDRSELYRAVLDGDTDRMEEFVCGLLEQCISTFDSSEAFYHGFFLSLLAGLPHYRAKSNREEGDGRPDIVLYPNRAKDSAVIFEVKIRKKFNQMQDGLSEAFRQIRDQRYEEGVLEDGYLGVKSYGICFCRKSCVIGRYEG